MILFKIFAAFILSLAVCGSALASQIRLNLLNTVTLRGEVSARSVTEVQLELAKLVISRGKSDYPIYLVLDSPGGSIMAGADLIHYTSSIPNLHTITFFAASMGAGIVQGIPGKRYIVPQGLLMFHRATTEVSGQINEGELESRLAMIKALGESMETTNASRVSMTLKAYREKVVNEWWLFGQQAITQKAADEIVTVICTADLVKASETRTVNSLFGTYKLTYSKCPSIRAPVKVQED